MISLVHNFVFDILTDDRRSQFDLDLIISLSARLLLLLPRSQNKQKSMKLRLLLLFHRTSASCWEEEEEDITPYDCRKIITAAERFVSCSVSRKDNGLIQWSRRTNWKSPPKVKWLKHSRLYEEKVRHCLLSIDRSFLSSSIDFELEDDEVKYKLEWEMENEKQTWSSCSSLSDSKRKETRHS